MSITAENMPHAHGRRPPSPAKVLRSLFWKLLFRGRAAQQAGMQKTRRQMSLGLTLFIYALVGLMPAGYMPADADADYLSNFAAFYSPTRKDIVILTGRKGSDVASDYIILVHEMTHAYQDAAHDLTATRGDGACRVGELRGLAHGVGDVLALHDRANDSAGWRRASGLAGTKQGLPAEGVSPSQMNDRAQPKPYNSVTHTGPRVRPSLSPHCPRARRSVCGETSHGNLEVQGP